MSNIGCLRSPKLRGAAFAMSVLVTAGASLQGQTVWRYPGAAAGALAGGVAGYAIDVAVWGGKDLGGPTLTGTVFGLLAGTGIGFAEGLQADRALRRGDTLSAVNGSSSATWRSTATRGRCGPKTRCGRLLMDAAS